MSAYLLGTCWGPGPTAGIVMCSHWVLTVTLLPCFPRVGALFDKEAEKSGDAPELSRLENTCGFPIPASVQQPGLAVPATEDRPVGSGPDSKVPQRERRVFGWPQPFQPTLLFPAAEEVKQSEGEEAEAVGGTSSHGCCLCQSGRSQQGDSPASQVPSS